ncbi:MAG: 1,4-alpha-glucan branching protein GlgB [Rubrobacteraceae bacterium]|nr:1,4-alpha-glucan branching protein GlgB [Rubrobacteraceae bacterium]
MIREDEIRAVVSGDHADPFSILGLHEEGGSLVVRAFLPGAVSAEAVSPGGGTLGGLRRLHPEGFFAGRVPEEARSGYRLRVTYGEGESVVQEDPYRFPRLIGDYDLYLFGEGTNRRIYEKLGAHPTTLEGVEGTAFAVWAPNARRVSVVGGFNGWDGRRHVMRKHPAAGVWEIFVPGVGEGALYKYEIKGPDGNLLPLKADPYGFAAEVPPATASIVHDLTRYEWGDGEWMEGREKRNALDAPISIYEVHIGSWRRNEEGYSLSYRELADELVSYVSELGYTHVEFLPVAEHPFYGSWGYQPLGMFCPSGRYGSPDDFRHLVDRLHQAGIGVIVDWVPAHFPEDAHGLSRFDGTHLYEHADPRRGRHPDWGTLVYNYGRNEVRNFLIANALFWLAEYHIDALRVDAVASMLYLDYSRGPGEWVPNRYGGNEDLEAIDFLKKMNEAVYEEHPGAVTIAEESTAWPMVSRPTYMGGLGFGYKWNMGWMHDTLGYISEDPIHRSYHHDELTFSLVYAFNENFILPLSHDEVVYGKGSIASKMPGDDWQKLANVRLLYAYMYAHPGKQLLFMGGELAQWSEWNHDAQLEWHLLENPAHRGVYELVRDLNALYRATPALHEVDFEPAGFEWVEGGDRQNSVVSFLRRARDPGDFVFVVCNFTPVVRHGYRLGVPRGGRYAEILNTDAPKYGGSGVGNGEVVEASAVPSHGREHSLELTLPPLGAIVLRPAR